ncbi:AAC(3) family N-acetyltransferase [Candidatus Woesearchaeota archaeon]|nr:AAC(3) family N-acetyltransferase [Candidatus Woesearchaeota archaeon]
MKMKKNQSEPLFEAEGKKIYYFDFVNALKEAGVKKGDTVFVHSRISAFGKLCTFDRNFLLQNLIDSIKECVGTNGTIVMPTFTYSFDKNEMYDVDNTKSTVGILTEFFRKQKDVSRTTYPNHSVAIWGKHKKNLLRISKDAFDKESIFGKLHKLNGKIIFLGAPFQSCTFIHYIEQAHKVPYRHMRKFRGMVKAHGKEYEDEITFYYKYSFFFSSFSRLEKHLLKKGLMKEVRLGNGTILMAESDVLFKEGYKLLDEDIYFLLKNDKLIFKLFNMLIYPFLRYLPWLARMLDKVASRIIH